MLIPAVLLLAQNANSAVQDTSATRKFFHNFNLCFQWFEIGRSIPLKQKQFATLDYGLDKYTANIKGGISFAGLGLGVYFRDKFGIEVTFASQSTTTEGNEFIEYLSNKYPGYYLPKGSFHYSSSTDGIGIRLCYRKHFKHFFIEPKFQFIINSFDNYFPSFRLKEIGTNQFIQYTMSDKIIGTQNSYHLFLNIAKRFNPFDARLKLEVGFMGEFMISPINQTISITETVYGQIGITNTESFQIYNPSFNFALTAKLFLEN
jgi:hypothetical protein